VFDEPVITNIMIKKERKKTKGAGDQNCTQLVQYLRCQHLFPSLIS